METSILVINSIPDCEKSCNAGKLILRSEIRIIPPNTPKVKILKFLLDWIAYLKAIKQKAT